MNIQSMLKQVQFATMPTMMTIMGKLGLQKRMISTMSNSMHSPLKKQQAFAGYTATKHDVFVCTYSKSGTNWMMQIAHQIAQRGQGEFDHIYDVIPWPDMDFDTGIALSDRAIQQASPTGYRVIKTHYEADFVPYHPHSKYLVVVRDPKDALISGYFFARNLMSITLSLDEWYETFISDHYMFDSWAAHIASYWSWRHRDNVLILTFNELKQDLVDGIRQVADLMGVDLAESELDLVAEKSSFAYMKAAGKRFAPPKGLPTMKNNETLIRKGKVGESAHLLTAVQRQTIDDFILAELQQYHSDFPYQEIFMK